MDTIRQDVRDAFRSLVGSKLITAVAVLSLGLGIGATSSIFSAVDVFMIRPLPFPDSHELVQVWTANRERGWTRGSNSVPDFLDLRGRSRTLDVAIQRSGGVNLSGGEQPERLDVLRVSPGFFSIVGVSPALGRAFLPEEAEPGAGRVVVLSDGLWRRSFGADPGIVGTSVSLDGEAYTVVGVMPPRFYFGSRTVEAWLPFTISGDEERALRYVGIVGRTRDGFSLEQARVEATRIYRSLAREYPGADGGNEARVISLRDEWFDEGFRQGSAISSVAVLFVLLIACGNVANLLLARGAARERELALRAALGAGRGRIVRQLLTESLVLALMGGALGAFLAVYGTRGLRGLIPASFPRVDAIGLDGRVLAFTAAASLVAGILFGLVPALQSSRTDVRGVLQEGGGGRSGGGGARLRKALVVSEIALSMALLVGSGLLIKSFLELRSTDMGFRSEGVLTAQIRIPETKYPDDASVRAFNRDLLDRMEALPGVESAGGTSVIPTRGNNLSYYALEGGEPYDPGRSPLVSFRSVTPSYFRTMDIPILAGRSFTEEDAEPDAPAVALVSEPFARRHWEGTDPVGARIELASGIHEVVGVVGETRDFGAESDPAALLYLPSHDQRGLGLLLHVSGDPAGLLQPVRETVQALDPDQPVYGIRTMDTLLRDDAGGYRAMTDIMGALGLVALVLSLAGVYGVMAYLVTQRTREVGIRMALGAHRGAVLGLILGQGGRIAAMGVGLGTLLALATARGLSFFLVGVSPFDPLPFVATAVVLGGAAMVATLLPARRAARVDPVRALRSE